MNTLQVRDLKNFKTFPPQNDSKIPMQRKNVCTLWVLSPKPVIKMKATTNIQYTPS